MGVPCFHAVKVEVDVAKKVSELTNGWGWVGGWVGGWMDEGRDDCVDG